MYKFLFENHDLNFAYEKDKISFIYFLYVSYILKTEYSDIKQYVNTQSDPKYNAIYKGNMIFRMANQNAYPDYILSRLTKKPFEYLLSLDNELFKKTIIELIVEYFSSSKDINRELENVELHLLKNKKVNNILILSTYIKEFIYNETLEYDTIYFNFYDIKKNTLILIYFNLTGKKNVYVFNTIGIFNNNEKFDMIFYLPPYKYPSVFLSFSYDKNLQYSYGQSYETIIALRLISRLNDNGELISLLSTGILNKQADINFKRDIVKNNFLEYIIEMPKLQDIPNLLSLIYLCYNSPSIKAINARKFASNIRRGVDIDGEKIIRAIDGKIEDSISIMDEEYIVNHNFDLTPSRFFQSKKNDFVSSCKLKDIVKKCFRGFQIPSSMVDEYAAPMVTKIKLLTLSDIEDGLVNQDKLLSLKSLHKNMEHYLLEKDDVVISCKGKTFKTAVVDIPYNERYVSTGSLIVIRVDKEKITPIFLKIFLDSALGVEALRQIQTGSTVLSLNPSQLLNIDIPLPNIQKQIAISNSYEYKLHSIKEMIEMTQKMKDELEEKYNKNFLKIISM